MAKEIAVSRKDVAKLVDATFPEYKGRKFRIVASTTVCLQELNWSGGTKSQYRAASFEGDYLGSADKFSLLAPWANKAEGVVVPIPHGTVVVEHTIFTGRDLGLRIWVHPSDMPRFVKSAEEMK